MRQLYCNHCLHIIGLPDNYAQDSITCPACGEEVSAHEVAGDPEAASRAKKISRPTQRIVGEVVGVVALLVICVLVYVFFISGDTSDVNTQDGISLTDKSPSELRADQLKIEANQAAKQLVLDRKAAAKAAEDAMIAADKKKADDAAAKARAEEAAARKAERIAREKELEAKRLASRKEVPVVTWLSDQVDFELDNKMRRQEFFKSLQCIKQMTMGKNTAVMGVRFGPKVSSLSDEAFKEFKATAVENFTEMLASKGTTLNDSTIDQQFMGDSYMMYRANLTNPLCQMFVGVQGDRAVFYWYEGSKLLVKKFRGAISQGEYRVEYQ